MKKLKSHDNKSIERFIFLNYFVIAVISIAFIFALFFIYKNIYQTIDTNKNHVLVKINPDFKPIDFNLYNETLNSWDKKISKDFINLTKDPFFDSSVPGNLVVITEENIDLTNISTSTLNDEDNLSVDGVIAEPEKINPDLEKVEIAL